MQCEIPYGLGVIPFSHPNIAQVVSLPQEGAAPTRQEQAAIIQEAMQNPIASPPLEELARGKKTAVVLLSDHTRPVPSTLILPPMLQALRRGNPDILVTLLVATGCHRGSTPQELREKLGEEIFNSERIVIHDCEDRRALVEVGALPSGGTLVINSLAKNADLLLAEGFIEPHFFAGFSGGRKSVLPGIAARETVLYNHSAPMIDSPHARAGSLEENPIHRDMVAAARMAGLEYILNVVLNKEKQVVAAFAGDALIAHKAGCSFLDRRCRVTPAGLAPIVITSNGGAPLDQNVYQTVKGLYTASAAAEEGGILILCARCQDGIGGEGFFSALASCQSPAALLEQLRRCPMEKTLPDQWQYQILARILERQQVFFVTEKALEQEIRQMKLRYFESLPEAVEAALLEKGKDAKITVIPNGVDVIVG